MLRANVRQGSITAKDAVRYDHFVAIDWSLKTMAIAHASRRDQGSTGVRTSDRPKGTEDVSWHLEGSLLAAT